MTGNAAVIRSKYHKEYNRIIVFLQVSQGKFKHKELPTRASRHTSYLFVDKLGKLRTWLQENKQEYLVRISEDIPDDRDVIVTGMAFRHIKAWIYQKEHFYFLPYSNC